MRAQFGDAGIRGVQTPYQAPNAKPLHGIVKLRVYALNLYALRRVLRLAEPFVVHHRRDKRVFPTAESWET